MGSHLRLYNISLLLLLSLLSTPLRYGVTAQSFGTNATLDPCLELNDCRPGLLCLKTVERSVDRCVGFSDENNPCLCLPVSPIDCNSTNYICPPGEGCGISKNTKNTFCMSCTVILDPTSNYTAFKGVPVCEITPTPFPTPSRSPGPPRRRLDLCSEVDVCEPPLLCASLDGELCNQPGLSCYCFNEGKSRENCATPADCPDPAETCLKYTLDNSTICGSCTRLNTDPFYVPADNRDNTCNDVEPRNVPDYLSSSRGLGFDDCLRNSECVKPLVCATNGRKCDPSKDFFCQCQSVDYTPNLCNDTSDCLFGEVCAKIRNIPPASCLSLSGYYSSPILYELQGDIPPRGNLVTFDDCTIDDQCREGLFCSHLSENSLGGCLNRRGCTCVPPAAVQCSSASDCRTGESCVRVPDAQQEAQCYSSALLPREPYFRDVSQTILPTPTHLPTDGWLFDLCKEDDDCKQGGVKRVCRHFTESTGSCDGRDMCVCKGKNEQDAVCNSSDDCGNGETCVVIVDSKKNVNGTCISSKLLAFPYFVPLYVELSGSTRAPAATPSNSPSVTPSTSATSSVTSSATSSATPSASTSSTSSTSPTFTHSPSVSESEGVTGAGETSEASESPDVNAVCVDMDALRGLRASDLVYASARRAAVLCDEQGSCATAGHMVDWHGETMMMKTYCEHYARCQRSVRTVNSPRMRRNLRIASRTSGLSYTPLAARFATSLEERLLRSVVRAGF